jgi:hypothetical protein
MTARDVKAAGDSVGETTPDCDPVVRPAGSPPPGPRWKAAAAWTGAAVVLFAFFLRISWGARVDSDGANNALQAWDMVHGHLLLHGWHIGDATFYFFELPLNGLTALLFGLGDTALHVASALAYLIVAGLAAVLAVLDSRGASRAARCGIVVAVLAAPLLFVPQVWVLLEEPDHIGTAVFMLAPILLIDRLPGWRFTAPLVGLILAAGQFSDLTVRYVAVPAIVVVCLYRVLAARKLRSADLAIAVAAIVSVPVESAFRALMTKLGAFYMVQPKAKLSSPRLWWQHLTVTWLDIRQLFGAVAAPHTRLSSAREALGILCLAAAIFGLARVAWTWRRASRAEQLLSGVIIFNVAVYTISVMPLPNGSRELAALLPSGAVLAARGLVPARVTGRLTAVAVVAAAAVIAMLPLSAAAARPTMAPDTPPLSAWLEAHGLRYGLAGYWDAWSTTVESDNQVQIRAIDLHPHPDAPKMTVNIPGWESNPLWYDPATYDATFAVADVHGSADGHPGYPLSAFEEAFGQPAARYRVDGWYVLVYRTNLLRKLGPVLP